MKNQTFFKKLFCLLLTVSVLLTLTVTATGAETTEVAYSHIAELGLDGETVVRAIIVLNEDGLIDEGGETESRMLAKQNKVLASIDGAYDLCFRYTGLFNGFALDATAKQLKGLEARSDVKAVYVANTYYAEETFNEAKDIDGSMMTPLPTVINADRLHKMGYYGDGLVVAVVDTGVRTSHESMKPNKYLKNPALTKAAVSSAKTIAPGKYISEKIPFAYNYAKGVTGSTDSNGHGTHVAGILGGYSEKLTGIAPGAQILAMGVLKEDNSTDSSVYLAALEDAYRLGANVINCSFGDPGGLVYDQAVENELYGKLFDKLDAAGISVFCSSGNGTSMIAHNKSFWSLFGRTGDAVPASYTDYGIVGSPAVYEKNIAVASANNPQKLAIKMGVDYTEKMFTAAEPDEIMDNPGMSFAEAFGGKTAPFVYINGNGTEADFKSKNVKDKMVSLLLGGTLSLQERVQNAVNAGAVGVILINDEDTVDHYSIPVFDVPVILIDKTAKSKLSGLSGQKLAFSFAQDIVNAKDGLQVSDYSSVGAGPDLSFKPQITGIGGYVYSAVSDSDSSYGIKSGTSMSCPCVAGAFTLLLQYVRDKKLGGKTAYEQSKYAESLLLCTTDILVNEENDIYSPRIQGTGLVDLGKAIDATALIKDSALSLGDDPKGNGTFSASFEVTSISTKTITYQAQLCAIMDELLTDSKLGTYNTGKSVDVASVYGKDAVGYAMTVRHKDGSTQKDGKITLSAGETVAVDFMVVMKGTLVTELLKKCKNGFFLDGYLALYNGNSETCHLSFISFVGDWQSAPAMESVSTLDAVELLNDPKSYVGKTKDISFLSSDKELTSCATSVTLYNSRTGEEYLAGINPYLTSAYIEKNGYIANRDWICISTSYSDAEEVLYDQIHIIPSMNRSVEKMAMMVNDVSGKLIDGYGYLYVKKNSYHSEDDTFFPKTEFFWTGIDQKGKPFASGTKVKIGFQTQLQYSGAELKPEFEMSATLDYKAPEISFSFDSVTGILTVNAKDETMLAGISVRDGDGNEYLYNVYKGSVGNAAQSEKVNLSTAIRSGLTEVTFEACDYAGNLKSCNISLDRGNVSGKPAEVKITQPAHGFVVCKGACDSGSVTVKVTPDESYCAGKNLAVKVTVDGKTANATFVKTENGVSVYSCPITAGGTVSVSCGSLAKHNSKFIKTVAPTCTEEGYDEYTCASCGETEKKNQKPAKGHKDGKTVITKEATKTTEGEQEVYCSVCKQLIRKESIPCVSDFPEGDVDGNRIVNAIDYMLLKAAYLKTRELTPEQFARGDLNHSKKIDPLDYLILKNIVLSPKKK